MGIIVNNKKYVGKFVATKTFNDHKVVASGKNPSVVAKKARDKGHDSAVVLYIPDKKGVHVF